MVPSSAAHTVLIVLAILVSAGLAVVCAVLKRALSRAVQDRDALRSRHESFIEESSRQIQSFARISAIIASSLERDQLLSQILLVLLDYLPGTAVRLLVYQRDGHLERIGSSEHHAESGLLKPTDENLFNLIASTSGGKRNPEWDLFLDKEARRLYAYNFPFIAEEQFKGLLIVTGNEPLPERTRLFLGDIAALIASAHQNVLTNRQKEKISEQFGKSVDPRIRDHLLSEPEPGALRQVSVLFLDIRNFTSRSEELGPERTVAFLNEIFTDCDAIIRNRGGFINKFTGDGFMAVFGAPEQTETHPCDAVLAAADMERILSVRDTPVRVGIGIASGIALAGTIGSSSRMEYTVIGDTVNTASRIEGLSKFFGTSILISGATREKLDLSNLDARYFGCFILKGKEKPVKIWGVRSKTAENRDRRTECWSGDFSDAIDSYFSGDFCTAEQLFGTLAQKYSADPAVRWFLGRSKARVHSGDDWDGIERLSEK